MTFVLVAVTGALFGASFALLVTGRAWAALGTSILGIIVAIANAAQLYL